MPATLVVTRSGTRGLPRAVAESASQIPVLLGFDALIAVYTGAAVNALTPVASNEEIVGQSCIFGNPEFEFDAAAGTTYWIAVDGRDGTQGSFNLQLNRPPANDDFTAATSVGERAAAVRLGSTRIAGKQRR